MYEYNEYINKCYNKRLTFLSHERQFGSNKPKI